MIFATYNFQGKRDKNLEGRATHHLVAGGLDTIEIEASDCSVRKGYRFAYQDKHGKWYEFIVASIDQYHNNNGVHYTVYGENSLVELKTSGIILDRRGSKSPAVRAIQIITDGTDWTGNADDLGLADFNFYHIPPMEALSETLKAYRCEFETTIRVEGTHFVRSVSLKKHVGRNLGKRFSYKKDMKEIKRTINEEDIITRLYAYGKGEKVGEGYGRRIDFADINGGKPYVDNIDAQQTYGYLGRPMCAVRVYDDIADKEELIKQAKADLVIVSEPTVTYSASVISLQGYGMDFEGVGIGDTVRIRDKELNLTLEGRVTELKIDPDGEKETEITIGSIREASGEEYKSVAKTLERVTAKEGALDTLADPESFVNLVIDGLNDAFKTTSSYAHFDPKDGLTFMDKPTIDLSRWAINIGSMGFRIAAGKMPNGQWNWRTFGTGEGFAADLICSGTLKANLVNAGMLTDKKGNNYWDMDNGAINIGNGAIKYNSNDGLRIQVVDDLQKDVEGKIDDVNSSVEKKADAGKIITTINASREGVTIAGDKVQITGETHIDNGVIDTAQIANGAITTAKIWNLSADKITGGTIDADSISVRNLNADNLTRGTVSRGVSNGSCTLPMSGSASLAGYGTNFNTGSSAFVFDYGTSTFEVQGSIAANRLGTRNSLESGGLAIVSDGGRVTLKPWNDYVKLEGSAEIRIPGAFRVMGRVNFDSRMDVESDVYAEALHVKNPQTGKYINVAEWLTT